MFKHLIISIIILGSTAYLSGQSSIDRRISAKDTVTDKNLVVPEEIERNFDQLLVDWSNYMKPSSSCASNYDTDVVYPDSVYVNRLYSLPTIMELAYNPVVRSYIDMYTGRMRSSVEFFLGKSEYYFPIFEQVLDKYGLPLELKYLPIIESALNPTIVSKAGATGLWQFMLGTGKMYDLEINSMVDERRDPYRSSDAAARYLKDLYNIYGDWNLVIAAYNCGPGNVNKAIKRNGGQSDYWSIYPYLPKETRGYVPAFIAATYVMNYPSAHNICPFEYKYNSSIDTIVVDRSLHFQQLSDVLNIPIDEVRKLNPQFKNDIIPGEFKQYTIKLPSVQASEFHVLKDSIYSYKASEFLVHRKIVEPNESGLSATTKVRYKVKRGESLASIASKHNVSTKQIRRWNRLKSNRVQTGQVLAIFRTTVKPIEQSESTQNQYYAEKNPSDTSLPPSDDKNGEVSNMLADYFKRRSTGDVQSENKSDTILGSKVDDPIEDEVGVDQETRTPNEPQIIYHKVRIGETVALIAARYNVEKEDITKWNKLKSTVPKIGQRLIIHLPVKPDDDEAIESDSMSDTYLTDNNDTDIISSTKQSVRLTSTSAVTVSSKNSAEITPKISSNKNKPQKAISQKPKAKAKVETKRPRVYTVKKGDTLGGIINRTGGKATAKEVLKYNNLRSDKLKVGQKIKILR